LVDAPCSGLGALRRRPEARWRKTPADIATLTKLQEQLLLSAIDAVRPGGVVAYVTCSPHLAETRAIVNSALKKRTNTSELNTQKILATVTRTAIPSPSDSKSLQLWPHAHNTDAMFIALISKHE
jgi:16S rRNA (cytosine967-C5)-methyltransferase